MKRAITISIFHQKGGVGKTTIAVNLAAELSKIYKTILVDCDPMGSAANFGNARSESLGEINSLTAVQKNFYNQNGSEISPAAINQELKTFREDYEVMIIDTRGSQGKVAAVAAVISDLVIIPVTPGYFDLWAVSPILEELEKIMIGNPHLKVRLLLNRRDDRTNLSREVISYLREHPDISLMRTTLGNRTIYGQSGGGLSVVEIDHHSAAATEINSLLKEIEEIFEE